MGSSNGKDWAIRILIGACFFFAGFAINEVRGSQETEKQVVENTTKINTIETTLERMERKLDKALGLE